MKKPRIVAIEYIRGISMLGVIGIHTGSQYLSNQFANAHLVAIFEIFTRFSVPIFFFVSAFGLFYNLDLKEKFNYKNFMTRRFKTVLLPYLTWSMIYLLHYTLIYRDLSLWTLPLLSKFLFFGLASYQLYFLIILLWFYALMPLWIFLVRNMTKMWLTILLIFQIVFNYYSSYMVSLPAGEGLWRMLVEFRLNYVVLHYIFIFIMGGYVAVHYDIFATWLQRNYARIKIFFFSTLAALLCHYYYLLLSRGYTPESAINTAHQLSPIGIFYTIAASLFFFALFSRHTFSAYTQYSLSLLGKHSYFAYLFHPLVIYYLSIATGKLGFLMTAPVSIIYYFLVTIISIIFAIIVRNIGDRVPILNLFLIGAEVKRK